jgi:hypothetical protein
MADDFDAFDFDFNDEMVQIATFDFDFNDEMAQIATFDLDTTRPSSLRSLPSAAGTSAGAFEPTTSVCLRSPAPGRDAIDGTRTTALERLSHLATFGDRGTGHPARRADSLQLLTSAQRGGGLFSQA